MHLEGVNIVYALLFITYDKFLVYSMNCDKLITV